MRGKRIMVSLVSLVFATLMAIPSAQAQEVSASRAQAAAVPHSVQVPAQKSGDPCAGVTKWYYGWHYGYWWRSGGRCYWSEIAMGWFYENGQWKYNWHRGWVYSWYVFPVWT